ncbi:hypothetical protein [Streptomyces winkii]|uniref:hypothetical protein n=1 Tax=Streptomyces winkii TaxID=3051178 RepID=UPI0028D80755|nr:hypothetical protein [Streptomyces sp. DSM 40971]
MNDVMLPWPQPRRPRKPGSEGNGTEGAGSGQAGSEGARSAPRYEIQRVNADGSTGPVEVLPITSPPWAAKSGRRGFLGAGIASSVAAALLLSGCDDDDPKSPSSPSSYDPYSPTPSPTESDPYTGAPTSDPYTETPPPYPTETDTAPPSSYYPDPADPTYGTTGGSSTTGGTTGGSVGGTGGTVCTCNKVCTCIPVCQAHRLLDPDPDVRRMAETVVVAMGTRELPYLRWAASEASDPLRTRIEELIEELRAGRRLGDGDLAGPGCESHLASGDPVVAMMAAQVLTLRALSRGTGLSGATAERAAEALTTGRALHVERAPAWSG